MRAFHDDLRRFVDLDGSDRLLYLSAFWRRALGLHRGRLLLVNGALTGLVGDATLSGQALPATARRADIGGADWAEAAPREPFSAAFPVRGWAADLSLAAGLGRHGSVEGFAQAMSGEEDVVDAALSGGAVRAFLAPDQRWLATRLFPADAAARSGPLDPPPGVSGHGIAVAGAAARAWSERLRGRAWLALASALAPSPLPPGGLLYGLEAGLSGEAALGRRLALDAELAAFRPGPFFLDSSDPERDALADLPTGWRVSAGVREAAWTRPPSRNRRRPSGCRRVREAAWTRPSTSRTT